MRNPKRWPCCLLIILGVLLAPIAVCAQSVSPRQLKPKGQMRGETYRRNSKLRELRLQTERRPADIPNPPNMNMGNPGKLRPSAYAQLNMDRERLRSFSQIGGEWSEMQGFGHSGFEPLTNYNFSDPLVVVHDEQEGKVEWWEMNERSRSQRGGWFRTRFGAKQGAGAAGKTPGMMRQQKGFAPPMGAEGMMPGGGGAGGMGPGSGRFQPPSSGGMR